MKKIFLDTNIILDVMAQRKPFNASANFIIKLGIKGDVILCATPLTFANCAYILKSTYKHSDPVSVIKAYKQYIAALTMDDEQCKKALSSDAPDFEDNLQYEAALAANVDCIITRNKKHFKQSSIQLLTADEFVNDYNNQKADDNQGNVTKGN